MIKKIRTRSSPKIMIYHLLDKVKSQGYCFEDHSLGINLLSGLMEEADGLDFKLGDHVNYPINHNTKTEVRQLHERAYHLLDSPAVPLGSSVCHLLAKEVALSGEYEKELNGWLLNEIGYQIYRGPSDWISPHRDRRSDQKLSLTLTVYGRAWINIYSCAEDPPDYSKLTLVDRHLAKPGTLMLLRAPGFGSGEQVIHEVCPPIDGPRLIVNLRMRPSVLKAPV